MFNFVIFLLLNGLFNFVMCEWGGRVYIQIANYSGKPLFLSYRG